MKRFLLFLCISVLFISCEQNPDAGVPTSSSGVSKATAKVATDLNGHTTEQLNVMQRLAEDNKPGSIKHLYIISAYSGDVILYSTVRGKVTSSGKRLTPVNVSALDGQYVGNHHQGFLVDINGEQRYTSEVLQDDGTYGSSVEYIYWFDSKGIYHQQYVTGGMIVHVSSQPIAVKKVILNLETATNDNK